MPGSFGQALQLINPFLVKLKLFHICPNDCILFRNEHEKLTNRLVCGESRYKEDGRTAKRNFTYFPLTPRIGRLFATKSLHEIINKSYESSDDEDTDIADIQSSKIWKEWFNKELKNNKNSIILNLSLDGVNPYSSQKIDYSMWPIKLSILNFPPRLSFH